MPETFRLLRAESFRRWRYIYLATLAIFVIGAAGIWYWSPEKEYAVIGIQFLVAFPVVVVFANLGSLFDVHRASRRLVASPQFDGAGPTLIFDENGMEARSAVSSGTVTWPVWSRARETKEAFLLYHSTGLINIVLKRTLSSPDDIPALRELIRSKLGSKATLL